MHVLRFAAPVRSHVFVAALAISLCAAAQAQVRVGVTNLVTDDPLGNPGTIVDAGLVNAWGVAFAPTSPFWVSSNGKDLAELYSVNPMTQAVAKANLTVTLPAGGVTGQVFTGGASNVFGGDLFLFVNEAGGIAGWRGALGTIAELLRTPEEANVYKGAAFATINGNGYLYAANFRTGTIDVVKGTPNSPDLTGRFTDPNLPAGYAPFNIQNLGGTMYVAYAQQDAAKHDEMPGAGRGFVDSFDTQGNLIARLASRGTLDAPWGLAIAPTSFGALAGALLVGNFGDGRINAFNPTTGAFLGQLAALDGTPLAIDGLWALTPGNDNNGGSSAAIYFTAGPDDESHGILGVLAPQAIAAVPEPASLVLMAAGLAAAGLARRRRDGNAVDRSDADRVTASSATLRRA